MDLFVVLCIATGVVMLGSAFAIGAMWMSMPPKRGR